MSRAVVLLRGVNVGGRNLVPMSDFKAVLETLGGRNVTTYVQSGNAVLDIEDIAGMDGGNVSAVAPRIRQALLSQFGKDIAVFVRTADELGRVVAKNPFPDLVAAPKLLHVAFLLEQPDKATARGLGGPHGDDEIAVGERVLYLRYSKSSIDSPLGAVLRPLGATMTARNWTTVTALLTLTQSS